tara:strand:- start:742 stop:1158 length:417 start_codon:yes stop_codon:yes gene_type:complete
MKAILINPKLKLINEINYSGDYKDISKLTECRIFTCVYPFDNCEDTIYLDDEGLLKQSNYCFTFDCDNGQTQPLMGNALILGTNDEGDSKDIETSLDEIKKRVSFKGHQKIIMGNSGIDLSPLPTILNDDDLKYMDLV